MTSFAHQAAQIDLVALAKYLEARLPGFKGPIAAEKTPTGQSNPTFLLSSPSGRYVLRKKPPGQLLKSAHQVDREHRVMKALETTDVPVPRMLILCADDGVIGTAFFVMEFVDGKVFWDPALPELEKAQRTKLYDEQNRALAALHLVDPAKVGLADFGKAGSYFARQRDRWTKQYRASETEHLEDMETLIKWLEANEPADDGRASLVHGDYRIDNMIFKPDGARLLAVIDWELSTIGHPFSDLAYQCMQWRFPNHEAMRGLATVDRTALGIPTEEEYIAKYCERMGLARIDNWKFCLAFSFFRLAAIVQGVKKRGLDGNASNPEKAIKSGERIPMMARMGVEAIA
ncbi:MAG: phosphotransferase family protein [Hyphomonadaceae bacterium]|jgi:aminoglycoside phosphotransferase (APT) family kinase protein|nr:phosphotransferase family protein [Hyphomonadaceae bacterium]